MGMGGRAMSGGQLALMSGCSSRSFLRSSADHSMYADLVLRVGPFSLPPFSLPPLPFRSAGLSALSSAAPPPRFPASALSSAACIVHSALSSSLSCGAQVRQGELEDGDSVVYSRISPHATWLR